MDGKLDVPRVETAKKTDSVSAAPCGKLLVDGYNVNNELLCAYGRYCFYICRFGPEPTSKETTGMKAKYICWIKRYKVLQYPLWPLCELSRGCEPPLHIYANPVGHHHRDREIGMTFLLAKLCARRNVWVLWRVQFKISLYCPIQSEMAWRVLQLTPRGADSVLYNIIIHWRGC